MTVDNSKQLYAPEVHAAIDAAMRAAIVDGTPWDMETPIATGTGEPRWVRTSGRSVREQGRTVRVIGAIQDVSERKWAELALADQQRTCWQ